MLGRVTGATLLVVVLPVFCDARCGNAAALVTVFVLRVEVVSTAGSMTTA